MDAIIIGAALPVSAIAPYNFAQRLAEGTRLFAEQFTRVLLPLATELGTATGAAAVHRLLLTSTRLTLGLALAVGVPLGLFGGQVLGIWVGAEYERFGLLVALLAVSAVMDVATYPATAILQGSNRHRPIAVFALLSGVVNVGLSVLLVGSIGSTGVALATLLATIAEIGVLLLPYLSRVLEVPASVAARQVVGRLVVPVGAYVLLLEGLVLALPLTSLRNLAAVLAIALIGYGLAYVRVGADAYERTAYRTAATAVRTLMRTQLSTRGR
jgi:O-antigen/teichoic acid export membrane protein